MKEEIPKEIEYLKECKGIEGTKLENLGKSTYDKIKSIISDPDKILTHLYIPKGSKEKAKTLESRFKEVFNTEINPEFLSFYQCFDGFELRYVNPRKAWKEIEFYFNFHASFRQRVYGIHNGSLGVYIVTDSASEITKDQGDDMRLYFKKYLIRSE